MVATLLLYLLLVVRFSIDPFLRTGGLQFFNSARRHGRRDEYERSVHLFRRPHGSLQCLQGMHNTFITQIISKCGLRLHGIGSS